jgi:hypothetical protein
MFWAVTLVVQLSHKLFSLFEVDSIIKELLFVETIDESKEDSANQRCANADSDRGECRSDLQATLLIRSTHKSIIIWEISRSNCVGIS